MALERKKTWVDGNQETNNKRSESNSFSENGVAYGLATVLGRCRDFFSIGGLSPAVV